MYPVWLIPYDLEVHFCQASMLYGEDIRFAQYKNGGRIVIMAEYPKEVTTDVPEHEFLADDTETDWDERARGLGGTLELPISSGRSSKSVFWLVKRPHGVAMHIVLKMF